MEIIEYIKIGTYRKDWIAWLEKQGTPAKLSEEEQNRFAKGVLSSCALSFIDYLDAHKHEGKMCVSNGECEDIENAFHNAMWDKLHRYYGKYIEKQGKQKEYTFKSLPRLLDMIEPTSKAKAYCQKLIDALVKEGYTTDAKIVGECLKAMNGENVPMAIMDEKQGEQNLAWSEEDDNCLINAINVCEINDYNETAEWLKDLKERVQPQPKPAWSEEDDRMMKELISYLVKKKSRETDGYAIFLKSLKFRLLSPSIREFDKEEGRIIDHLIAICDDAMCYDTFAGCSKKDIEKYKTFLTNLKFGIQTQPQSTWKPSEEQMIELRRVISGCSYDIEPLTEMEEQLNKLREE